MSTAPTKPQASTSADAPSKIVFVIPVPLETVYAEDAALAKWIQYTLTRRTSLYLLIQKPRVGTVAALMLPYQPQDITSRVRAICERNGAACSVLSEKPGRMLICVSSSNVTTESPKTPASSSGPESSSSALPSSGTEQSQTGSSEDERDLAVESTAGVYVFGKDDAGY